MNGGVAEGGDDGCEGGAEGAVSRGGAGFVGEGVEGAGEVFEKGAGGGDEEKGEGGGGGGVDCDLGFSIGRV